MKRARRDERNQLKEVGAPNDPNLEQLREEFMYTLNERDSSVFARARLNHETRYCVWSGQSEDGKKWTPQTGEQEVFPWDGASDARVNLVDMYVRKHAAFLMVLWNRMRTQVSGTEVNDEAWAHRLTTYLRWMKYTQMEEARAEHELLANYMLERGAGVMGVFWRKLTQLQYEELDLEGLTVMCARRALSGVPGEQGYAELPTMVLDPSWEAEAGRLLAGLFTDVPAGRMAKVAAELRQQGYARFPRPQVLVNRPRVVAYAPNDDIFLSPDANRMEDASVFQVEVMREAKFRAYARDYEWDAGWAEEVLETQRGAVEFGGLLFNQRLNRNASWLVPSRGQLDTRKLYLVVHAYRRLADAEGVPGIYYTVFHPQLTERHGRHELLNYDHGQMPYVLFQQERRSRRIDDSRGYGEVASTWQGQIKAEWDNRIDRASIQTLPPSFYPPGKQPDKWGPGVQVPTQSPTEYGFFDPKGDPMGSKEVELSVRAWADEYFGFTTTPEKAVDAQMLRQKLADDWMAAEARVDTQILQLCQQFEGDDIYYRVVGSAQGKLIHTTRDEIQGRFDVQVQFAVENMDAEQKKVKLALMQQMLAMDVNGIVDHNEALVMGFDLLDPNAGERLLRPAEGASQAEVEDEMNTALKLMWGIPVPVKPGQAYQLRLKVLGNFLQTNAQAQRMLQSNPQVLAAVQQRVKDLTFQVQQRQNAVIGRGGPQFTPKPQGPQARPQARPQMAREQRAGPSRNALPGGSIEGLTNSPV